MKIILVGKNIFKDSLYLKFINVLPIVINFVIKIHCRIFEVIDLMLFIVPNIFKEWQEQNYSHSSVP